MNLCPRDLAEMTGGQLRLASMPPRDGDLASIGRLVLSAEGASAGDVYWCLSRSACNVELAYLRGALGVVAAGASVEPWPGRFSVQVDNSLAALARLIERISAIQKQSLAQASELKVLQLCAEERVDIYPPTCGQSANSHAAKSHAARRCRRQAA
jgi:hypothetical protein